MKPQIYLSLFFLVFLFAGCQSGQDQVDEQVQVEPANMEVFGEGTSIDETTQIADILADPASFVGKTVKIEGRIKDVCPMQGCWIEVETEDGQQAMIVKVNDGEIVFKQESKGKHAVAEGEVYAIEMNREKAVEYMEHLAEEKGEAFDPTSVEGPMTIYQIKGTGALVAE